MKKLLLGLLALSTVSFGNGEQSATMEIRAIIKAPLKIVKVEDINFGIISAGTTYTSNGKYSITGEAGSNVVVKLNIDNLSMYLDGDSGKSSIPVEIIGKESENRIQLNNGINSNGMATVDFPITAMIDIPENQQSGEYRANLIASVRYD